ncbi:MAG TPA: carboxypeptidase regulatory-like domain-containing protein [Vicinamibacterales bacterium]|nr:carboxypeptidase regulatory-like domain-containing protein [Vicinamibacterales bacterium]
MTRVRSFVSAVAVALAVGLVAPALGAAGGTIAGTVRAHGQASADTVVYIVHADGSFKRPAKPPVMNQHFKRFIPHVLPVMLGTAVEYHNEDSFKHNVFSPDYGGFNLGAWGQGATKTHTYSTCANVPCAYRQMCLIHPHMLGFVVVLQNPYFATSGSDGRYTISNVPPGKYTLAVWHEGALKAVARPMTVENGKTTTVDFTLQ